MNKTSQHRSRSDNNQRKPDDRKNHIIGRN